MRNRKYHQRLSRQSQRSIRKRKNGRPNPRYHAFVQLNLPPDACWIKAQLAVLPGRIAFDSSIGTANAASRRIASASQESFIRPTRRISDASTADDAGGTRPERTL